ncbi:MAG: hypothetical protein HWE30_03630 [Methylocystaceae bacterium]|nr:hypothetical protein [Methylocystaceae bacterium]
MKQQKYNIWEDDEFVYIPEELFEHLPEAYRQAAEATKQKGEEILRIADKDIQSLIRLMKATPTTSSLSYIFHRLRTTQFELTMESVMEQEILTAAFIVTYGRLAASSTGVTGIKRKSIPEHLRPVHDEIIDLRNKRYAHNGAHETVDGGVEIIFDENGFKLNLQMHLGFHVGGKNEWEELITFIDSLMHERLTKILDRLKERTGYEWTIPNGPPPSWVGDYG